MLLLFWTGSLESIAMKIFAPADTVTHNSDYQYIEKALQQMKILQDASDSTKPCMSQLPKVRLEQKVPRHRTFDSFGFAIFEALINQIFHYRRFGKS